MRLRAAVLCGVAALCTSCATVVMMPLGGQIENERSNIHSKGVEIRAYVTHEGAFHAFEGRVLQRGDSLEFWSTSKDLTHQKERAAPDVVLPVTHVTTLFSNHTNAPLVASSILITVVTVAAVAWLAAALIGAYMY
jgi:hypothetical protein